MYRTDNERIYDSLENLDPIQKREVTKQLEAYSYETKWGSEPPAQMNTDCNIVEPLAELILITGKFLCNWISDACEGAAILYRCIKEKHSD